MAIAFAQLGFEAEPIPRVEYIVAHRGVQYVLIVLFWRAQRVPPLPTLTAEFPFLARQWDVGEFGFVLTWRLGPKEQPRSFEV